MHMFYDFLCDWKLFTVKYVIIVLYLLLLLNIVVIVKDINKYIFRKTMKETPLIKTRIQDSNPRPLRLWLHSI